LEVDQTITSNSYDYDLVVIGGGSGGLALAQEAAKISTKKIAVLDFVKPTPQGTSWGLGGTCVNVGCIPKKLMHQASLLGESLKDSRHYGWETPENIAHNWQKMVDAVQDHIGSLNWGYRTSLREKKVEYINAYGVFVDPHTLELTFKNGKKQNITAQYIVVAVGGRPSYLDIPGAKEYCLSSDDLFSLATPPGKSLVVGASYVALECAGFLTGLGYDTSVMARSIFLRGFDQDMATRVTDYMQEHGTKFIRPAVPVKVEKIEGKLKVTWKNESNIESAEFFDTVLLAVGRKADTAVLNLEKAGVIYDKVTGKIPVVDEQTNVPNIFAIGDVITGNLELTPVAIKAGRLLARRLFTGAKNVMDYKTIPTTVFTPLEYSSVGLTEENAIATYGEENIEIYHVYYQPLEWVLAERENNACYAKVICNKKDNERILGIHVLGPSTGEVIQGFALALKCGATKEVLDSTVGIHPTTAEELLTLNITKRSGETPLKKGC